MKNIIICLFVVISLYSCDLAQDIYANLQLGYSEIYYHDDFKDLDTPEKIFKYLDTRLTFDLLDRTATPSPEEILYSGKANCRGYTKVFVNIMYVSTGVKMGAAGVEMSDQRAISSGGSVDHCIVYHNGKLYDPQSGECVMYSEIGYIYRFDDFLYEPIF